MLKSGGILVGFVRPMYAFGRPRELRSRGLIKCSYVVIILALYILGENIQIERMALSKK